MPRLKIKREPGAVEQEDESAFQIREEIVRWDNVKTAHDLQDDMEVAQMLLNCYDLVGGNFLVWSDTAKVAPPPLHTTLRLQHVSEEGWAVLQEIKALGAWSSHDKTTDKSVPKKSRRKQSKVRHIIVKVQEENQESETEEEGNDSEVYVPQGSRSRPGLQKKDDGDYQAKSDEDTDEEYVPPKPDAPKKRGRPRKGEVRPKVEKKKRVYKSKKATASPNNDTDGPKPPKQPRKKKEKSEEEQAKKTVQRKRRVQRNYQCNQCQTVFPDKAVFLDHFKTHSDKKKQKINITKEATLLFRCIKCDVLLYSHREWKAHSQRHEQNISRVCDTCGIVFTRRSNWGLHMKIHEVQKSNKWYVCKICKKKFHYRAGLLKHLKRHTAERPHVCEVCGKAFKQESAMMRHRHIHSNVKPLSCEFCGKGFTNRYNLKGHLRTHTGEKPFKCDKCGAAFTHNVSLKTHKRSAHGIDLWKDQKSQLIEEYDEVNLNDPKLFEKQKVDIKDAEKEDTLGIEKEKAANVQGSSGIGTTSQHNDQKECKTVSAKTDKKEAKKKVKLASILPRVAPEMQPLDISFPPFHADATNYPPNVSTIVPLYNYHHSIPLVHAPQPVHDDSKFLVHRYEEAASSSSSSQQQQTGGNWTTDTAVPSYFTRL